MICPADWVDLEQERRLIRYLAIRCPQGTRRRTDAGRKPLPQFEVKQPLRPRAWRVLGRPA